MGSQTTPFAALRDVPPTDHWPIYTDADGAYGGQYVGRLEYTQRNPLFGENVPDSGGPGVLAENDLAALPADALRRKRLVGRRSARSPRTWIPDSCRNTSLPVIGLPGGSGRPDALATRAESSFKRRVSIPHCARVVRAIARTTSSSGAFPSPLAQAVHCHVGAGGARQQGGQRVGGRHAQIVMPVEAKG